MELVAFIEQVLERKRDQDQNSSGGRSLRLEDDTSFIAARMGTPRDEEGERKTLQVRVEVEIARC